MADQKRMSLKQEPDQKRAPLDKQVTLEKQPRYKYSSRLYFFNESPQEDRSKQSGKSTELTSTTQYQHGRTISSSSINCKASNDSQSGFGESSKLSLEESIIGMEKRVRGSLVEIQEQEKKLKGLTKKMINQSSHLGNLKIAVKLFGTDISQTKYSCEDEVRFVRRLLSRDEPEAAKAFENRHSSVRASVRAVNEFEHRYSTITGKAFKKRTSSIKSVEAL